jgi:hypothetical protein
MDTGDRRVSGSVQPYIQQRCAYTLALNLRQEIHMQVCGKCLDDPLRNNIRAMNHVDPFLIGREFSLHPAYPRIIAPKLWPPTIFELCFKVSCICGAKHKSKNLFLVLDDIPDRTVQNQVRSCVDVPHQLRINVKARRISSGIAGKKAYVIDSIEIRSGRRAKLQIIV